MYLGRPGKHAKPLAELMQSIISPTPPCHKKDNGCNGIHWIKLTIVLNSDVTNPNDVYPALQTGNYSFYLSSNRCNKNKTYQMEDFVKCEASQHYGTVCVGYQSMGNLTFCCSLSDCAMPSHPVRVTDDTPIVLAIHLRADNPQKKKDFWGILWKQILEREIIKAYEIIQHKDGTPKCVLVQSNEYSFKGLRKCPKTDWDNKTGKPKDKLEAYLYKSQKNYTKHVAKNEKINRKQIYIVDATLLTKTSFVF